MAVAVPPSPPGHGPSHNGHVGHVGRGEEFRARVEISQPVAAPRRCLPPLRRFLSTIRQEE